MPDKMIKAIRNFIASYILEHKYPPSVREIADGVGLKSTSSAQHYLDIMIEAGILETDTKPRQPRALRIPGMSIVISQMSNDGTDRIWNTVKKNNKPVSSLESQLDFLEKQGLFEEQTDSDIDEDWIPCDVALPEEKINPVTMDYYEYEVTFQSDDLSDIRHYKFGDGHWWNGPGIMDKYVTAWRQRPEPYRRKQNNCCK